MRYGGTFALGKVHTELSPNVTESDWGNVALRREEWKKLGAVGRIESEQESKGKVSIECAISSPVQASRLNHYRHNTITP